MKKKIKLVFFDMEGPIFDPEVVEETGNVAASVWSLMARHLKPKAQAEEEATKVKWNKGLYKNYFEWCEDTLFIYKKYGFDADFFYKVINKIKYIPGAKATIAELRRRGYVIAMITGGFKNLADRAIFDLGIHHVYAAAELFFHAKTKKLVSWNLLPSDYHRKVDFMKTMMKEHGLSPKECAFIGDGVNDIPLAKQVGLSIAFNGRKELQKVATYSINQKKKDLRAVLKYL